MARNKESKLLYAEKNLTRKMVEYSLVLPKFIRERGSLVNKILRLEQEGEHLHAILNSLETKFKNIFNKEERYYVMLKKYENKIYSRM